MYSWSGINMTIWHFFVIESEKIRSGTISDWAEIGEEGITKKAKNHTKMLFFSDFDSLFIICNSFRKTKVKIVYLCKIK